VGGRGVSTHQPRKLKVDNFLLLPQSLEYSVIMPKKFILAFVLASTFLFPIFSFAQTTQTEQSLIKQLQDQIKALQVQITALTKQIEGQKKEIEIIKTEVAFTKTLQKGMTGEEVKKLQTFLKQFPDIYPEGLVTGYYGSLTEIAIRKLQEKQGLEQVGFVGPKTLEKLNALITGGSGSSGTIPPGLLTAPGIQKKVELPTTGTLTAISTTTTPVCAGNYSTCTSKSECELAKFFWYTVSCHPNPVPSNSCASSYNYCPSGPECAANGWYSCRGSCYGSLDACLGQTYLLPAVPLVSTTTTSSTTTATTPIITTTTGSSSVSTTTTTTTTTTINISPTSTSTLTSTTATSTTDVISPSTPTGLTATAISSSQINLSWTASTDNIGVAGYKIYRDGIQIRVVTTGTSFSDTDLIIAGGTTTYLYKVAAYDTAGNVSAQTGSVSATTQVAQSHTCGTPISVPQDAISIQTALNLACDGDTIYVSAGTYNESLTIPKENITLKGTSGTSPENVIIDSGNTGSVITVGNAGFNVEGLTLRGATSGSSFSGAGLFINGAYNKNGIYFAQYAMNVTARNLIIKNNSIGILITNVSLGTINLERNLITSNSTGIDTSNIGSSQLYITNNTIAGNSGNGYYDWAGGGYRTFRNNIIALNGKYGVNPHYQSNTTALYNDLWNNALGNYFYSGSSNNKYSFMPSPGTGELAVDPKFVSSTDYHLQSNSPVINVGDPSISDPDGSRVDMGAYPTVISSATLSLSSTPSGATVTNIDSGYSYCQSTPCNSVQVAVPPNSVNIKISKTGYYDWTNLIYVYSGQTTNVSATLSAISATTNTSSSTTASSTSFNLRTSNLSSIYYTLDSLKTILGNLSKLLQ